MRIEEYHHGSTFHFEVDDLVPTLRTVTLDFEHPLTYSVGNWQDPHSFHVAVTLPGREKEKEWKRERAKGTSIWHEHRLKRRAVMSLARRLLDMN